MSHPPEDWSKLLEDPWTFNPFPVGSRAREGWKDTMLSAKEHVVLFSSEILEKMPQEDAPNQAFLNHRLEAVAGLFGD